MSDKAVIRGQLLAARRAFLPDALAAAARQVIAALLPQLRPGTLIAAYAPVGAEPGGSDLPDALLGAGVRVLLPVLRPDLDLDWAPYEGALVSGPRGLRQPAGQPLGVAAIGEADLVVVPALAVDRRGHRLGRGGGSYDRALARVGPDVPVVALLHDGELLDDLPAEPHDRPVTAAITPSDGWCDLRAGRSCSDAAHLALESRECQNGGI